MKILILNCRGAEASPLPSPSPSLVVMPDGPAAPSVFNATDRTSGPVTCSYMTQWGSQGSESEETIVDRSTDVASRCFSFSYKLHIGSNLPPKDNLRKEDKSSAPKVSFIQRFLIMCINQPPIHRILSKQNNTFIHQRAHLFLITMVLYFIQLDFLCNVMGF